MTCHLICHAPPHASRGCAHARLCGHLTLLRPPPCSSPSQEYKDRTLHVYSDVIHINLTPSSNLLHAPPSPAPSLTGATPHSLPPGVAPVAGVAAAATGASLPTHRSAHSADDAAAIAGTLMDLGLPPTIDLLLPSAYPDAAYGGGAGQPALSPTALPPPLQQQQELGPPGALLLSREQGSGNHLDSAHGLLAQVRACPGSGLADVLLRFCGLLSPLWAQGACSARSASPPSL